MPCHFCVSQTPDGTAWDTACGIVLDADERRETVLTNDWGEVNCKGCKRAREEGADE